jgi:hypothetical protein
MQADAIWRGQVCPELALSGFAELSRGSCARIRFAFGGGLVGFRLAAAFGAGLFAGNGFEAGPAGTARVFSLLGCHASDEMQGVAGELAEALAAFLVRPKSRGQSFDDVEIA